MQGFQYVTEGYSAVFHLKRNHTNLATEDYSENLIAYLNDACCCKITVEDLNNVLHDIMNWSIDETKENQSKNNIKDPQLPVRLAGEKDLIQYQIASVIKQKGSFQNGCFKKTKHVKFSEKQTFVTP